MQDEDGAVRMRAQEELVKKLPETKGNTQFVEEISGSTGNGNISYPDDTFSLTFTCFPLRMIDINRDYHNTRLSMLL